MYMDSCLSIIFAESISQAYGQWCNKEQSSLDNEQVTRVAKYDTGIIGKHTLYYVLKNFFFADFNCMWMKVEKKRDV